MLFSMQHLLYNWLVVIPRREILFHKMLKTLLNNTVIKSVGCQMLKLLWSHKRNQSVVYNVGTSLGHSTEVMSTNFFLIENQEIVQMS